METQNTNNAESQGDNANSKTKSQRSPFAYSKIVFTEYGYAKQGQHFMKVESRVDGKKVFLAKVFKTYDGDAKKFIYNAVGREDKPLFEPTQNIYELKKQFIANEQELVQAITKNEPQKEITESANIAEPTAEKTNRAGELSQVRKGKKEKSNEIER